MSSPRPDKRTLLGKPDRKFGSRASREAIDDESESDIDDAIDEQRRTDRAIKMQKDIALAELRIIEKFHATKVRSAVTLLREIQVVTRPNAGTGKGGKGAKGEAESVSVTLNYRFLPLRADEEGGGIFNDGKALFELFMKTGAGRRKILTSMKAESVFAKTTGILIVSGEVLVPWKLDKLFIKVGPYPAKEALAHLELDLSVVAALHSGEHVEFTAVPREGGTVIDTKLLKNYDPIPYGSTVGKRILPFSFALNILAASGRFGLPLDLEQGFIVKASIMAFDEDGEKYAIDVTTDKSVWIDAPCENSEESKEALGHPSAVQKSLNDNSPESAAPRKHRSESLTREDSAKRPKFHQGSQQAGIGEGNLLSMSAELSGIHTTFDHNLSGALTSNWGGSLHHTAPLPLPPRTPSNFFNIRYDQTEAVASPSTENKLRRADDASIEEKEPLDIEPHFAKVTLDSRTMVDRYTPSRWTPSPDHAEKAYKSLKQRVSSKATHDIQNTFHSGPPKASGEADPMVGSTKPYQGTKMPQRREDIVPEDPNPSQTIITESNVAEVPPIQIWSTSTTSRSCRAPFGMRVKNIARKLMRKSPLPSHHRLEWTCGCGENLYTDINKRSEAEIARLATILQCNPEIPAQGSTSVGTNAIPIDRPPLAMIPGRSSSSSSSSLGLSFSPLLRSSPSTSFYAMNTSIPPRKSYLELCINTGEYTKTLSEIDLVHVGCDGELFRRIRSEYLRLRSFRSKVWLLKPSGVHFVKFAVQNHHRVGILQKPLSIPPQHEVDAKNYFYTPCPLQDDPPMPEDIFLHYLSCTEFDPSPAWLPRLPKKLDPSILRFTGVINEGWGIHINEGPNWSALGWINLVVMILSGVAAGLWKYFMDDFQGAFGFAGWIVAVVNAVLVACIAKWSQQ